MDLYKWMWRGVLTIVTVFLLFMGYYLVQDSYRYFSVQIREFTSDFIDEPTIEFQDDLSGLIVVNHRVDLQKAFETLAERFETESYPLKLSLCLRSLAGFYKRNLACDLLIVREKESLSDLLSFDVFQHYYYLPNVERSTSFETVLEVQPQAEELVTYIGQSGKILWSPRADLRLIDGTILEPTEISEDQDLVMVFSRWKDLALTWNNQPAEAKLVQDPDRQSSTLKVEEGDPPYYQWLLSVPDLATEQKRLCIDLAPSFLECYLFKSDTAQAASLCGNGIVDSGEDCDDANVIDNDGCTNLCRFGLVSDSLTKFNYPKISISSTKLSEELVMVFVATEIYVDQVENQVDPNDLDIRVGADFIGATPSLEKNRVNDYPYMQALFRRGDQATIEFVHHQGDQQIVYQREDITEVLNGLDSELGTFKGASKTDDLSELVKKYNALNLLKEGKFVQVSEKVQVSELEERYTKETFALSGLAEAATIQLCLINLDKDEIISSPAISVQADSSFFTTMAEQVLDAANYAVLFFSDRNEDCEHLLREWVAMDERSPLPVFFELVDEALGIDVLEVNWMGTEDTEVDSKNEIAIDKSRVGREFNSIVQVKSLLDDEVRVYVLVDNSITFTHAISPGDSDDILINVESFDYGQHEILVYALLADGQRTADVVFPFEYGLQGKVGRTKQVFETWQKMAIIALIIIGGLYVVLRYKMIKERGEGRGESGVTQ